jgi:hypothetical protein
MKFLFIPVSVGGGFAAGFIGKKLFEAIWGVIDEQEPPEPEHRYISVGKLVAALAIEGAIFRLIRGLFDHYAREGFLSLTGSWPGEEEPEPQ